MFLQILFTSNESVEYFFFFLYFKKGKKSSLYKRKFLKKYKLHSRNSKAAVLCGKTAAFTV
ncbi:hypothetical protein CUB97_00675 [Prevotella intermedia]|uniref:Uncharacterized protein n=1 Tax=Prevotella intermedia TaxID=28131 RepID=A0A2M8M6U0_PREIN|nr:hypothetical protein CUB97_00675 [Prevotella intermedia]